MKQTENSKILNVYFLL